ncbi:exopolysaccharide biosynthesis polyprenyl glycosylphosphotransferase [filamentous cyanobacterium LEGE 11480]|uniref:Exopolysaccharide biosynthesis polyprenyl glycosylphosphotransferase n=1 Tax=Romeriopsis navalis LEGE 11480 TaxID=2777977 RepID=A0A928VMZ6_9CYAN|nr:exopolysaccharide biosynthesis polyprenyl glycosylphosphotransferase [Romeriopsis navalis]MBE9030597.1 exopolysaccharide biosynthesis polyprenyl glycosylphosphotransferase [Romeriopsis navalis LEGE 11480]
MMSSTNWQQHRPWIDWLLQPSRLSVVRLSSDLCGALVCFGLFPLAAANQLGLKTVWVSAGCLLAAWLWLSRLLIQMWRHHHERQSQWLLLSNPEATSGFSQQFRQLLPHGELVALTQSQTTKEQIATNPETSDPIHQAGPIHNLLNLQQRPWSGIILDPQLELAETHQECLMEMRLSGIPVYRFSEFYETFWSKLPSRVLWRNWFTLSDGFQLQRSNPLWWVKRMSDVVVAVMLSVLLAPLMLLATIAIKLNSPGPIFYSQIRTGLNQQPFRVYKFRSMYQDAESRGAQWAKKRDPRITPVGNFLRMTRIDELPQIWNVLRGDMSLIGPRPERPEFDEKLAAVIPYYYLRYRVKPGITGWAQVMYPYGASVEDAYEKLSYDLYYMKNYSLGLELQIFLKTIKVVVLGKGR